MSSTAEASAASGVARIGAAFATARAERRAALMPYLMGGFPDSATATSVAIAYADSGADLIELGVPFSDPLADGPVIHDAAARALASGADLDGVLRTCETVADRVAVVPMCYANMVLARGPERFAHDLAGAGAAGVIVPDLPPEEAGEVREHLAARGLAFVPLVAPTTPPTRRAEICREAEGFVYLVSDTRTTGEREDLPAQLPDLVAAVKREAEVPVAVGFGIGTPAQAAEVGAVADGVIIGSRLVRAVAEAPDVDAATAAVREFLAEAAIRLAKREE
jgi:tryptophan synthase alpha chain